MIQVIGLHTTSIQEGFHCYNQCIIHTKTEEKCYDYVFTPDCLGRYTLHINPTVHKAVEVTPIQPTELIWHNQRLLIQNPNNSTVIFDTKTSTFFAPLEWFKQEEKLLPKRQILIIHGNPEYILMFIDKSKSIAYADEWDFLPSSIPEDVIVLNNNPFPLSDILMRLPQRTEAIIIRPTLC